MDRNQEDQGRTSKSVRSYYPFFFEQCFAHIIGYIGSSVGVPASCRSFRELYYGLFAVKKDGGVSIDMSLLGMAYRVSDDFVIAVTSRMAPKLITELHFGQCFHVSESVTTSLIVMCSNLTSIDLYCTYGITDAGVKAISRCHFLKTLELSQAHLTDDGFRAIGTGCPRLISFNSINTNITDVGMVALVTGCPSLTSLTVSSSPLTDVAAKAIGDTCHAIVHLHLDGGFQVTDDGFVALLTGCPELTNLNISGWSISNSGIKTALSTHPSKLKLTELDISYCPGVTGEGITAIAENCPVLKVLHLLGIFVDYDEVVSIEFPSLTSLQANSCEIEDTAFACVIAGCPNLLELCAPNCLTDNGLKGLGACKTLRKVYLEECVSVTDVGMQAIAKGCVALTDFSMSDNSNITDDGLRHLSIGCVALRRLSLHNCTKITNAGIKHLGTGCRNLVNLSISSNTNITNNGLQPLTDCSGLRKLVMNDCRYITAEGVALLKSHWWLSRIVG